MDAQNDPMSSSQYEASIMALRQGAKIDANNNTILLNLSHALLVSGRAEKALGVVNVLRSREPNNVEIENVFGACLIQLGRDEEAQSILRPFANDAIVSETFAWANFDLNMLDYIVKEQIERLKLEPFSKESELTRYFEMLALSHPKAILLDY